jgi:hypothetical protein
VCDAQDPPTDPVANEEGTTVARTAELETRVGGLERLGSLKTGVEWLTRATQALLDHNGVQIRDVPGAVEYDD